jgi:hypothetical protein
MATQIAAIEHMKMPEIWALWDSYFPNRPAHPNRLHLESRLKYKLQERALGGLPARITEMLANHGEKFSKIKSRHRAKHDALPGTVLHRDFDGQQYKVLVLSDGRYEFEKKTYKSLSAIAKLITGTQWSGPAFFGLKGKS